LEILASSLIFLEPVWSNALLKMLLCTISNGLTAYCTASWASRLIPFIFTSLKKAQCYSRPNSVLLCICSLGPFCSWAPKPGSPNPRWKADTVVLRTEGSIHTGKPVTDNCSGPER
jgi:hypothetical protein